jgi:hypothetical protein
MPGLSLVPPTVDLVTAANARFDRDERYGPADRVLTRVFLHHPHNDEFEDVLIKVVLLNRLYNTNVIAVMEMAAHIRQLRVDDELAAGEPAVVGRIAALKIREKTRRHYSFATKYCSWHQPDQYPIYDSLVQRSLWLYQGQFAFGDFRRPDLQDYPTFKAVVSAFRGHFGLEAFTFKQLDKFLWFTSKDLAA